MTTAEAPCCGAVVDVIDVLDRGECTECGTPRREIHALAEREPPEGDGGADSYAGP